MMTERDEKRYALIPRIRRARGYYLYDYDGRRYVDLYQDGGRAVLGHRDKRVSVAVKDVLSKGLVAGLPSVYTRRFVRALSRSLPDFPGMIVASSMSDALDRYAALCGIKRSQCIVIDPLVADVDCACDQHRSSPGSDVDGGGIRIGLWRPFVEVSYDDYDALVPVLPFAPGGAVSAVCFRKPAQTIDSFDAAPFVLAGATRALYNLASHTVPDWCMDFVTDGAHDWKQYGLYLLPCMDEAAYDKIWKWFLERGFLLSPRYPGPSVLPQGISPGERAALRALLCAILD